MTNENGEREDESDDYGWKSDTEETTNTTTNTEIDHETPIYEREEYKSQNTKPNINKLFPITIASIVILLTVLLLGPLGTIPGIIEEDTNTDLEEMIEDIGEIIDESNSQLSQPQYTENSTLEITHTASPSVHIVHLQNQTYEDESNGYAVFIEVSNYAIDVTDVTEENNIIINNTPQISDINTQIHNKDIYNTESNQYIFQRNIEPATQTARGLPLQTTNLQYNIKNSNKTTTTEYTIHGENYGEKSIINRTYESPIPHLQYENITTYEESIGEIFPQKNRTSIQNIIDTENGTQPNIEKQNPPEKINTLPNDVPIIVGELSEQEHIEYDIKTRTVDEENADYHTTIDLYPNENQKVTPMTLLQMTGGTSTQINHFNKTQQTEIGIWSAEFDNQTQEEH